jgi:hypothetical protein
MLIQTPSDKLNYRIERLYFAYKVSTKKKPFRIFFNFSLFPQKTYLFLKMFSPKVIVPPLNQDAKSDRAVESPTSYFCSTNHYQQQLNLNVVRQYSLQDAIRLASQANMKHDANGCCCCDTVAGYYMTALKYARENEPIQCNSDLYDLVWRMTNLVLAHRETSKYQYLNWFDTISEELWKFAKQLKEESYECDLHIPTTGLYKRGSIDSTHSDNSNSSFEDDEENYRRAIRINIYNCRALVYEQSNEVNQAIIYYRKCAAVRSTPFEPQQHTQQSALAAMHRLIQSSPPQLKQRTSYNSAFMSCDSLSSSTTVSSASSSTSSKSSISCSSCGIEKKVMPVCAKCKTQPYCSVRCMKTHKSTHTSVCSPQKSS